MKVSFLLALLLFPITVLAQTPELNITTKNKTETEQNTVDRVKRITKEYDLSKWIFTKNIIVEDYVIPHSHPVLTLNSKKQTDDALISTFIHEQTHWFMDNNEDSVQKAIAVLKKKYPKVPYGNREGARDEYSTYLHLLVCYIEYKSLIDLVGKERARVVMEEMNHYTWVYETVLKDTEYLSSVLTSHGLIFIE